MFGFELSLTANWRAREDVEVETDYQHSGLSHPNFARTPVNIELVSTCDTDEMPQYSLHKKTRMALAELDAKRGQAV